jgi:hypothetical protein
LLFHIVADGVIICVVAIVCDRQNT